MERRNFLKFVFAGLLTMIAGEFQVNVLVLNKGANDYLTTIFLYLPFFVIMYLFGVFCDRKFSPKRADLFCYFFGGLFGLIGYEWFLIGNAPWAGTGAIQTGMFAWWAAIPIISRIFTTPVDPLVKSVRRRVFIGLLIFSLVSTAIVAISPTDLKPIVAAFLITIGFFAINFQFIPYLTRNGSSKLFIRAFMWFLVLAAVANLFI
ncbi:MAG: hypothetical protein NTX98_02765 [Candidatus Doudnabacteria bacterium]|nr:hypothetical protein [Candidatus Doudnabacteria bacterium]